MKYVKDILLGIFRGIHITIVAVKNIIIFIMSIALYLLNLLLYILAGLYIGCALYRSATIYIDYYIEKEWHYIASLVPALFAVAIWFLIGMILALVWMFIKYGIESAMTSLKYKNVILISIKEYFRTLITELNSSARSKKLNKDARKLGYDNWDELLKYWKKMHQTDGHTSNSSENCENQTSQKETESSDSYDNTKGDSTDNNYVRVKSELEEALELYGFTSMDFSKSELKHKRNSLLHIYHTDNNQHAEAKEISRQILEGYNILLMYAK